MVHSNIRRSPKKLNRKDKEMVSQIIFSIFTKYYLVVRRPILVDQQTFFKRIGRVLGKIYLKTQKKPISVALNFLWQKGG